MSSSPATCLCGVELAPTLLCCPSCQRLVHAAEIEELCDRADDPSIPRTEAISLLRQARALVPTGTKQARWLDQRIDALGQAPEKGATRSSAGRTARSGWIAGAAGIGLVLWKFKVLILLALSKLKFLALGLTKAGTLLSMLLSFGAYWTVFGWPYALGLVLSIYVHEMGHVVTLRHFGIPASPPMFVPGLGAYVRLQIGSIAPKEDARIGLAGPLWGLGAALFAYGLGHVFDSKVLFAIAASGAIINLFNLLPIWQLDGGRGARSQSRVERFGLACFAGALAYGTENALLWAITILLALRSFEKSAESSDAAAALLFAFLLASLAGLHVLAQPPA